MREYLLRDDNGFVRAVITPGRPPRPVPLPGTPRPSSAR